LQLGPAWRATERFAGELGLRLNAAKSARFHAGAGRAAPLPGGPPLVKAFRDLGVTQRLRPGAPDAVRDDRVEAALDRLSRIRGVASSFLVRARMVAACVCSSLAFGSASGAPPAGTLAQLRSAAAHAVRGGRSYGAPELLLLLPVPAARADPEAAFVLTPLVWLARFLHEGTILAAVAASVGPAFARTGLGRALLHCLRRLELSPDLVRWRSVDGTWSWDPAAAAPALTRAVLAERWEALQLRSVAARRRSHCGLVGSSLTWARSVLRSSRLTPSQRGALFAVFVGDTVTQNRLGHFKAVSVRH
jgi:hypothetical protein